MRWPIRMQLLLPMLSVVVLAIALASAAVAYWRGLQARQQQEDDLRRVAATLAEANFPLTDRVLGQISGLSRAEFALLDARDELRCATLALADEDVASLRALPAQTHPRDFAGRPRLSLDGRAYLANRVALARRLPGGQPGSLVVLYAEDRWWGEIVKAAYPALLVGAVVIAAVVLVTTLLAQRIVGPIQQLGQRAATIAEGDFRPMALPARDDELRDLAVSINRMSQRLSRYESEVRRSERMRTLGQLGAGMAHTLRNAAAGASLAIELHQRERPEAADCESLEVALRQLKLMESYLQRFLRLGRSQAAAPAPVSLATLVDDVVGLVEPACRHAKIDLQVRKPSAALRVEGDVEALRQLLVNLALNAVEAASRPDQPAASARVIIEAAAAEGDRAILRVLDSGPGPSPQTQERLFDPFVTEKPDGTGLGLYVAREIAEAHRGAIAWRRCEGMTCFAVELPLLTT